MFRQGLFGKDAVVVLVQSFFEYVKDCFVIVEVIFDSPFAGINQAILANLFARESMPIQLL